jgi:hypothetical protein
MIGCAILGLDMASAHTDTCSEEIARVEALADQSMGNPIAKPTISQSVDAQLHHQPTRESVRRAEENAQSMFATILAHAKMLEADGKTVECIQSVAEAKRLLRIDWTERHTNPRSNQADFKAMIGGRLSLASFRPTRNAGQTSRQRAQGARRCRSIGSLRTSDARPSRATRPRSST